MKQWLLKEPNVKLKEELSESLGISDVLSQILINRDITDHKTAHTFLYGKLSDLYDWQLLPDIQKARLRIKEAISKKENILIYGDYDVDGVTACVLLKGFLSKLGANVTYYIPHRIDEGYGLNRNAFPFARTRRVSLIITVDCGISAHKEVEFFNKKGIDVIITDHHKPKSNSLPPALAMVCPQRADCQYPFKELSGVGVVFKLAQAVCENYRDLSEYLDLVALGTVADIVPLLDENRILVREGLKKFATTHRKGLRALMNVSGLNGKDISTKHIGYILGPRINVSGRLGSADAAVRLLITEDDREAQELASKLHASNRQRQKLQEEILNQALVKIEREINFKEQRVIVLEDESWHPGVIGIVASKIAQEFYRPTIIISTKDSLGKGSGRSIKNFHLFEAIDKCRHLLVDYGGHEGACGISILKDKIKTFSEFINEIAHKVIKFEDLLPTLEIDVEVPLAQIKTDFIKEVNQLSPFGSGNPEPMFLSRGLTFKNKPVRFGRDNFKGWITDGQSVCEVVGFGIASILDIIQNKKFDIVYHPYLNAWEGIETIRLSLKDVRLSE
jgi:single-stranded-DNA-specific exonuclease